MGPGLCTALERPLSFLRTSENRHRVAVHCLRSVVQVVWRGVTAGESFLTPGRPSAPSRQVKSWGPGAPATFPAALKPESPDLGVIKHCFSHFLS